MAEWTGGQAGAVGTIRTETEMVRQTDNRLTLLRGSWTARERYTADQSLAWYSVRSPKLLN